ncbi:helix-turn-helix domain-containing protein [Bacillus sp. EAC]|uniref:BglG family transcription antiterminator n=1 Tax=Bacillus sp. EAC TaxID=1978338 RepID=UPI000B430402|nr:helix-turn-helix domain-containing protein [Bacillus sp. EAC]
MDKSNKRKLQIIDILTSHDKWFKTEDLAKELSCTEKTIRNDLQAINMNLPEGWVIETIKGKGIYIKKPITGSVNQIRSLYIKNSLTFQAIMYIQFKKIKTINELATVLYATQQAVYKILDAVEGLLKSYNLKLKRGPLEIDGREFEIRLLCCDILDALYSHTKHSNENWPFETFSFFELKNIVSTITTKHKLFLYPLTTNKYVYFLATMINRIEKEIDLGLNDKTLVRIIDSEFYKVSSEISDKIENQFSLSISLNERIAFTLSISKFPYVSFNEIEKQEFLTIFYNKNTPYYEELYDLVETLEKNLGIPLLKDAEFLYTFQNQFKRYSILTSIEKKAPSYSIDRYVYKHYPELFNQVTNILFNWTKKKSYPEVTSESVAKVTLNIQASKINLSIRKKKILLLTSNGPGVHRYISMKLKKAFGHHIDFLHTNYDDFESEKLNKLDIEFIIADFQLEIETIHPVIIIDPMLTQRDINQISRLM